MKYKKKKEYIYKIDKNKSKASLTGKNNNVQYMR